MNNEPTNKEILEAISAFFGENEKQLSEIKAEIKGMKATMVTKSYLDDKMADLRGDLVVLMRKEDVKVKRLIEILQKRKVITGKDVKDLMSMEPFPQLSL
ncbi:MAG: hypothetical protein ABIE43_00235 [Patescibacteria group bacterium]